LVAVVEVAEATSEPVEARTERARRCEDNFRKTITQLFAWFATLAPGGVALAAAVVAYLQLSEQQRSAHDLLISQQVSKGFEQLGGDKLPVRLGGIYALEGVMNTSKQYHQPVLEALCAFVRDRTQQPVAVNVVAEVVLKDIPPAELPTILASLEDGKAVTALSASPTQQQSRDDVNSLAIDVRAALVVIGRRNSEGERRSSEEVGGINLSFTHIPMALLVRANLSSAYLEHADLSSAPI